MYDVRYERNTDAERFDEQIPESPFEERQLLLVSNRQPYRHTRTADDSVSVDRPTGGLTASLDPTMQRIGGTWVAWGDGDADPEQVDESDRVEVPPSDPSYTLRRVWLSEEQVQSYYYGFSNQVLWPLCHSSLATVRSEQAYWDAYRRTNEQFADVVATEATDRSLIWLHDYHFGLAASSIRRRLGPQPLLAQFWHIPWPPAEVFLACPHGEEILDSLLATDLVAFHVARYCQHFLESVDRTFEDATINWRTGSIIHNGRKTRVRRIPMGVPVEETEHGARNYGQSEFDAFKRSYDIDADTNVAFGVDRLDYSKGIPERIRALELFWERSPEWRGALTHLLNCTPSRSRIPAYQRVQETVTEHISRINDRFGTDDWQPIVEITDYLSQQELQGVYRHADLCLVTPISDGLNLIAAEYAATQVDDDGVLVLSEQAGIHDLLGDGAVSISPYDPAEIADGIETALTMSHTERRSRMRQLRETVGENNLETWIEKHEAAMRTILSEREVQSTST